jgi:hypothetical protein
MVKTIGKYINGPMNTIRLEGHFNGISKTLWIFGDIHLELDKQLSCENIRSQNIIEYLVENFDKISADTSSKPVDFFLETYSSSLIGNSFPYHSKYIWEVQKLVKKSINTKNGKVIPSIEFPKVRFHYVDVREYMQFDNLRISGDALQLIRNITFSRPYSQEIVMLGDAVKMLAINTKTIGELLFDNSNKSTVHKSVIPKTVEELVTYSDTDIMEIIKYLINKILNDYKHPELKKFAKQVVDEDIRELYDIFMKKVSEFLKHLEKYSKFLGTTNNELIVPKHGKNREEYLFGIQWSDFDTTIFDLNIETEKKLTDIVDLQTTFLVFVVDLFFLRRFLDKTYVTNAAVYTGISHSANYIYYLVKYFGFNITHTSYLKSSIDDTEKAIKSAKFPEAIYEYIYPKIFGQCSNLTSFPELFK